MLKMFRWKCNSIQGPFSFLQIFKLLWIELNCVMFRHATDGAILSMNAIFNFSVLNFYNSLLQTYGILFMVEKLHKIGTTNQFANE